MNHGNRPGTNRKDAPQRKPGAGKYVKDAYNRAVRRAIDRANAARQSAALAAGEDPTKVSLIPRWHVNQLRHSAATQLRAQFGLETAGTVLGHSSPQTTIIYAEADFAKAAAAMKAVG